MNFVPSIVISVSPAKRVPALFKGREGVTFASVNFAVFIKGNGGGGRRGIEFMYHHNTAGSLKKISRRCFYFFIGTWNSFSSNLWPSTCGL